MPHRHSQRSEDQAAARRRALIGDYRPLPGIHDELMDAEGNVRPHWDRLLAEWTAFSPAELNRRLGLVDRHLADSGVSHRIFGEGPQADPMGAERSWPISHVPLPISADDWRAIESGVIQRATLLEEVLRDIYGPARLVADGVLPAAAVAGSPDFLRSLQGVPVPGGKHLLLYAADLGRGPDGGWWVLGDRAQAPSGAGYALENRLAMALAFPDQFRHLNIARLAVFFQAFRTGLVAGAERVDPRICLWTPGPLSETYFEQAYLARYLGFVLVEGGDLVMRDDRVHIRTIAGLKRADVIWRRIDGDFADPLELNGASQLGVAGLVHAMRRQNVVLANSLGAGAIESRALMSFLPALCETVLGQRLELPNVATWWCGQAAERETVLKRLERMAIAPAFRSGAAELHGAEPEIAAEMDKARRARLVEAIRSRGVDYVGEEVVHLSTVPVLDNGVLAPRPFSLRVYAAATPDGWKVMPGGFCRISDRLDARAVNMREGARSSDVWVLSDQPVAPITLLPRRDQIGIRRIAPNLPSRAADNLFWLGRYLERAEAVLRLVRALVSRLVDADARAAGNGEAVKRLTRLLVAWGAAPAEGRREPLQKAEAALYDLDQYGSAAACLAEAQRTASITRERLSIDAWRVIVELNASMAHSSRRHDTEDRAYAHADRTLRAIAAFAGLAQENMNRGPGWRFLELGRRLERAINTCRFARQFGEGDAPDACLDVLLDLIDSPITYRARYVSGVAPAPVLDMALFDDGNPRSVCFQVLRMEEEVSALPVLDEAGRMEPPRRIALKLGADVRSGRAEQVDRTSLLALEQGLMSLSDAIGARYFLQAGLESVKPKARLA